VDNNEPVDDVSAVCCGGVVVVAVAVAVTIGTIGSGESGDWIRLVEQHKYTGEDEEVVVEEDEEEEGEDEVDEENVRFGFCRLVWFPTRLSTALPNWFEWCWWWQ
jgi:hypothetical protein